MKVSDYMDGLEEVFNPKISYKEKYSIPYNMLLDVAKYDEKRKNMVQVFFDNYYFNNIVNIFSSPLFPNKILELRSEDSSYGRCLKVDMADFIHSYFACNNFIIGETDIIFNDDKISIEELVNQVKEVLSKRFKEIKKLKKDKSNTELMATMNKLYLNYIAPQRMVSFDDFIDLMLGPMTNFKINLKYYVETYSKPIDLKKLEKCIDLDKFYFEMAYCFITFIEKYEQKLLKIDDEKEKAQINETIQALGRYVKKYISIVKKLIVEEHYDISLDVIDARKPKILSASIKKENIEYKKVRNYKLKNLLDDYKKLFRRYPDLKIQDISDDVLSMADFRNFDEVAKLQDYITQEQNAKTLLASWDFIAKGEKIKSSTENKQEIKNHITRTRKNSEANINDDELLQHTKEREEFLEQTHYKYKLKGLNKFTGYIGYMYPNGKVIFEKFYKDENDSIPEKSNATYVMSFENFVEMSRKTKPEIINYIKQGATDLRRLYHTTNWRNNVNNIIQSNDYTKEQLIVIENLVNLGLSMDKSKGIKK